MRNPVYKNEESGETFYVGSMRTLEYVTNLEARYKDLLESRDFWRKEFDRLSDSNKVTYYVFGCSAVISVMIFGIIKMLK